MAPIGRRSDPPVDALLFTEGYEFGFFQAVRLLRRLFLHRKDVGGTARPSEEVVRFGAWLSMNFPASQVDFVDYAADRPDAQPRMTVTFLGLTGTNGILPLHYTERLLALKVNRDSVLAEFFDLFNHRLVSLFYRAWAKYNPPAIYETASISQRGLETPEPDLFSRALLSFIGLGTDSIRGHMAVRDESLIFYSGLIAQSPHSASALRGILKNYFALNHVEIEQFLGSWYTIEPADRAFLAPNQDRNQLGVGAFLGDRAWNQQDRFRIRLGPLNLTGFRQFFPDGPTLSKLGELTRFLTGQALTFDVQLLIEPAEIPLCRLTDQGPSAPRLGWMSWLKTETTVFETAPGDAVFRA